MPGYYTECWGGGAEIVIDVLDLSGAADRKIGRSRYRMGSVEYVSLSIYLSNFFEAVGTGGEGKNRRDLSFTSVITISFCPSVC
jgi:hypothetical protein